MTATVIASLKMGLTDERLAELRASGLNVEEHVDLTDLPLQEPQRGEEVVGTLTETEAALFKILYDTSQEVEDMMREGVGAAMARLGEAIRTSDRNKSMHEVLSNGEMAPEFTDEQEQKFFRLQQLSGYCHAMFHYTLGERLGLHSWRLGVRSKNRIVKIAKR